MKRLKGTIAGITAAAMLAGGVVISAPSPARAYEGESITIYNVLTAAPGTNISKWKSTVKFTPIDVNSLASGAFKFNGQRTPTCQIDDVVFDDMGDYFGSNDSTNGWNPIMSGGSGTFQAAVSETIHLPSAGDFGKPGVFGYTVTMEDTNTPESGEEWTDSQTQYEIYFFVARDEYSDSLYFDSIVSNPGGYLLYVVNSDSRDKPSSSGPITDSNALYWEHEVKSTSQISVGKTVQGKYGSTTDAFNIRIGVTVPDFYQDEDTGSWDLSSIECPDGKKNADLSHDGTVVYELKLKHNDSTTLEAPAGSLVWCEEYSDQMGFPDSDGVTYSPTITITTDNSSNGEFNRY